MYACDCYDQSWGVGASRGCGVELNLPALLPAGGSRHPGALVTFLSSRNARRLDVCLWLLRWVFAHPSMGTLPWVHGRSSVNLALGLRIGSSIRVCVFNACIAAAARVLRSSCTYVFRVLGGSCAMAAPRWPAPTDAAALGIPTDMVGTSSEAGNSCEGPASSTMQPNRQAKRPLRKDGFGGPPGPGAVLGF
jgi:hypothetical protein